MEGNSTYSNKKKIQRSKRKSSISKLPQEKQWGVVTQGIFNLGAKTLTGSHLQVLNKGLKFAPDKKLNKFETFIGIHKFIRNLNLKKYFVGQSRHANADSGS